MNILKHELLLRNKVFFTKNKWPHFDLLFNDIKKISKNYKNKNVVFLERTNLYGGVSLFAPFFLKSNFISVDCITEKILSRGHYNKKFLEDSSIIKIKSRFQYHYNNIKLKNNSADVIVIPNLMHHVEFPEILLKKSFKILKKNGIIYIFEPLVRELHQVPEDYGRFSPSRIESLLKNIGFKKFLFNKIGGPFSCISYYWDQALQYLPIKKRYFYQKWLKQENKKLFHYDNFYKKNLIRSNSESPMAFSVVGFK